MKKVIKYDGGTRDYGILSDASKSANRLLGDTSGRSISMRTAHGFKKTFQADISDNTAEDIVHFGMAATVGLLSSESEGARAGGILLGLGLLFMYQNGQEKELKIY